MKQFITMALFLSVAAFSASGFAATEKCESYLKSVASVISKNKIAADQFSFGELVEGQYSVSSGKLAYVFFTDENCQLLNFCKGKSDDGEKCWDAK